jgi:hypothetical protein
MPVEFFDYKGEVAYVEKPFLIDDEYAQKLGQLMKHHEARGNNGWTKERTMRFAGSIPKEVWFNKIQESGNPNYWEENRGLRMKQWLNEHEYFRVGGKFIKGSK